VRLALRAEHTRRAVQGIEFEATVIGECGQAGQLRDLARLLARVTDERVGILAHIGKLAADPCGRFVDRQHVGAGEERAELVEPALVTRREHEGPHLATA